MPMMTKAESIEAAWAGREQAGLSIFIRLADLRGRLSEQQGGRCCYCGIRMAGGRTKPTLEHILPRALGGTDDEDNLVVACERCNGRRGDRIELVHIQVFVDMGLITAAVAAPLIAQLTDEAIDLAAERAVLAAPYKAPSIRQLSRQ